MKYFLITLAFTLASFGCQQEVNLQETRQQKKCHELGMAITNYLKDNFYDISILLEEVKENSPYSEEIRQKRGNVIIDQLEDNSLIYEYIKTRKPLVDIADTPEVVTFHIAYDFSGEALYAMDYIFSKEYPIVRPVSMVEKYYEVYDTQSVFFNCQCATVERNSQQTGEQILLLKGRVEDIHREEIRFTVYYTIEGEGCSVE